VLVAGSILLDFDFRSCSSHPAHFLVLTAALAWNLKRTTKSPTGRRGKLIIHERDAAAGH
jgi:hypothetical protein